jgi:hypothetical protein
VGSGKQDRHGPDERDRAADLRDDSAEARDRAARDRDQAAGERDQLAFSRDKLARDDQRRETDRLASVDRGERDAATRRKRAARPRGDLDAGKVGSGPGEEPAAAPDSAAESQRLVSAEREAFREFLEHAREYQAAAAADRRAAAHDRRAAAGDRRAAARDRELAALARQQSAVEAAQVPLERRPRMPQEAPRAYPAPLPEPVRVQERLGPEPSSELGIALRAATARQTEALESAQQAAHLANQVALTEESLAATLREADAQADKVVHERRLALAQEATEGARAATERGERLKQLTQVAADHLELATVRVLLSHAALAFGELARAERSIASAMSLLAAHDSTGVSAEHRHEAEQATAAAERAYARAEELHRLESATHGGPPKSPDQKTEDAAESEGADEQPGGVLESDQAPQPDNIQQPEETQQPGD